MSLKGEDIYEDTLHVVGHEVVTFFYIQGIQVTDLYHLLLDVRICLRTLQEQTIRQLILCNGLKPFHVLIVHGDINIIIPRDETTMAYGSQ